MAFKIFLLLLLIRINFCDSELFWLSHPSRFDFEKKIQILENFSPLPSQSESDHEIMTSVARWKKLMESRLKHVIPGNPKVKMKGKKMSFDYQKTFIEASKGDIEIKRILYF